MTLYYYKAKGGNFGDDLNELLWSRLLPELLASDDKRVLVGIGSIFDTRLESIKGCKIIFGTGINSQKKLPVLDSSYDIRFMRGPISAHALGRNYPWISDAALAIRLLDWPVVKPIHDVGFMPHFLTVPYVNWPQLCDSLGFHYISPQAPVEHTLVELRSCRSVITEAMHGAIVCDTFRIPWVRVAINAWQKEDFDFSALKWLDWGLSVGADVTPVYLEPLHSWGRRMLFNPVRLKDRIWAERKLARELRSLPQANEFRLSNEPLMNEAIERIHNELVKLRASH